MSRPATATDLADALWVHARPTTGRAAPAIDYLSGLVCLAHLSHRYERAARRELGKDWPGGPPHEALNEWYQSQDRIGERGALRDFESQLRTKVQYVIRPYHLWANLAHLARTGEDQLVAILKSASRYIEHESFSGVLNGLLSGMDLDSVRLGPTPTERNTNLCTLIAGIADVLDTTPGAHELLPAAFETLIERFADRTNHRLTGDFHTPRGLSDVLGGIATLNAHDPMAGPLQAPPEVLDFACGTGSLLLNVHKRLGGQGALRLYGQEKSHQAYTLARRNMLLQGVHPLAFDIWHGDTLTSVPIALQEEPPVRRPAFDIVIANPPPSHRWSLASWSWDPRFRYYGKPPKSTADFAFLLHGLHYLKEDGVLAVVMGHGALIRDGGDKAIRAQLLEDNHLDTVIGLPQGLFYSTGAPASILVLKKRRQFNNVLFIDASNDFEKTKPYVSRNVLGPDHVARIVETYRTRPDYIEGYARTVLPDEIAANDFNLNLVRYVKEAAPADPLMALRQYRTAQAGPAPTPTPDDLDEDEQVSRPAP